MTGVCGDRKGIDAYVIIGNVRVMMAKDDKWQVGRGMYGEGWKKWGNERRN